MLPACQQSLCRAKGRCPISLMLAACENNKHESRSVYIAKTVCLVQNNNSKKAISSLILPATFVDGLAPYARICFWSPQS